MNITLNDDIIAQEFGYKNTRELQDRIIQLAGEITAIESESEVQALRFICNTKFYSLEEKLLCMYLLGKQSNSYDETYEQ